MTALFEAPSPRVISWKKENESLLTLARHNLRSDSLWPAIDRNLKV